jgi:hypothetical protein
MDQQAPRRTEMQAQLIERASRDPAFRQELLANPKAVIERESGVQIPDSMEIRVLEETPSTAYLVLPAVPVRAGQPLADQELEDVAGGGTSTMCITVCVCAAPD